VLHALELLPRHRDGRHPPPFGHVAEGRADAQRHPQSATRAASCAERRDRGRRKERGAERGIVLEPTAREHDRTVEALAVDDDAAHHTVVVHQRVGAR
jgi:hypothetical protein